MTGRGAQMLPPADSDQVHFPESSRRNNPAAPSLHQRSLTEALRVFSRVTEMSFAAAPNVLRKLFVVPVEVPTEEDGAARG